MVPKRFGLATEVTLEGTVEVTMKEGVEVEAEGKALFKVIVGATETTVGGGLGRMIGGIRGMSFLLS